MGCKNSKEIEVLELMECVEVSINVIQNSILNICECKSECKLNCKYNFCDRCMIYKTNNMTHCKKCDECHDNNKSLFCDFCLTCINFNSEVDIMKHRRRHDICKLLRERNRSI